MATVTAEQDYHTVNINRIEAHQARSIGVETLACHAVRQLQLDQKLTALGFNKIDSAAALGSIIGRMVSPGSELQTHDWLQSRTGLGELLDHDYGSTRLTCWYTISDRLLKHQAALEAFLAAQEQTLFDLNRSIVLYDLTNTCFEGQCAQNPKAQFGRSKEKLKCCPLVTLGLVLDGNGFPLSSQVFPGNASEPATLALMLDGLQGKNPLAGEKPVIIMDAGIASADNIAWLSERGYLYLVVSRERDVQDPRDQDHAVLVRDTGQNTVSVYRTVDAKTGETRLYCYSDQKAKKNKPFATASTFVWKRRSTSSMPAWTKKARSKTTLKYSNASVGCAKKTAASRKTTALKSLPMTKKTTPFVLTGSVSPKVH